MQISMDEVQNGRIIDGWLDKKCPIQMNENNNTYECSGRIKDTVHQLNEPQVEQKKNDFQHIITERDNYDSTIKEKVEKCIKLAHPDLEVTLDHFNWDNLSTLEQRKLIAELVTKGFPILPPSLVNIITGSFYYGDRGRSPDEKPDWLDIDKFRRGQKFALDYYFGINFAQMLSLFTLFSFDHGLKPLIISGKSSTPYTSFKRYLSTGVRVRNWYTENPWEPGTAAYKDIQTVRKLHSLMRVRLNNTSKEDVNKAATIDNAMCPTRDMLLEDLQGTCPAPALGQCPYVELAQHPDLKILGLNQGEMSLTQFGFLGLVLLYPKAFGIHNATEEDFEAFCHTWRGLGYLLGIDDDFNFCRGTVEEIKERCKDYLNVWVKPNFREITPEWEHMMRCVIEGVHYYFPSSSYEVSFLYLTELMSLHMPRLYNSLTYLSWIRYYIVKSFFYYTLKIPGLYSFMNKRLTMYINEALKFSPKKLTKLEEKSNETLKKFNQNAQSYVEIVET